MEGGRDGGREGGREAEREREVVREGGSSEGGREGGRERDGEMIFKASAALPVTPAQLMRPDIGRNRSCALGDFIHNI